MTDGTSPHARLALIAALLILLAAFGTRFHALEAQSLWNDEGNSLRLAQRSPADLVDAAGRDIHPPGYYLLLKAWTQLAGESEFGLRSLSAFEGVLTVAFSMALSRLLFRARGAALLTGLLVTLNPFAIYYSQEARMYAQLGLLSVSSIWILVHFLAAQRRAPWIVALAVVNAAGMYTHYAFPFTLLAQGVVLVALVVRQGPTYSEKTPPRKVLVHLFQKVAGRGAAPHYALSGVLALLLFLPWLPTAWDQVTNWPRTGTDLDLVPQVQTVLTWLTFGSTRPAASWALLAIPLALAALAFWGREHRWHAALLALWAFIVTVALFVSGAYRAANLKFLLSAQVALALLIGAGLWGLLARRGMLWRVIGLAGGAVMLIAPLSALDALYHDAEYARADYRAMAVHIQAAPRPDDAVILDAPNQAEVFSYYYTGDAPVFELPRGLGGDDVQTVADVRDVISAHRRIFVLFWGEEERDPNRVVQATLDAEAYPVTAQWVGDVRLAEYAVLAPPPDAPAVQTAARFGADITLTGYALQPPTLEPGVIGVTLFWSAAAQPTQRYKVTVQLLGPDGGLISQHDAEPGNNRALTTTWEPGQTVSDTHGLVVPSDLIPGAYTIIVGMYELDPPYTRLPVSVEGAGDGAAMGDIFTLATLQKDS